MRSSQHIRRSGAFTTQFTSSSEAPQIEVIQKTAQLLSRVAQETLPQSGSSFRLHIDQTGGLSVIETRSSRALPTKEHEALTAKVLAILNPHQMRQLHLKALTVEVVPLRRSLSQLRGELKHMKLDREERHKATEALNALTEYEEALTALQQLGHQDPPTSLKLSAKLEELEKKFWKAYRESHLVPIRTHFEQLREVKKELDRTNRAQQHLAEYKATLQKLEELAEEKPHDLESVIFENLFPHFSRLSDAFWRERNLPDAIRTQFKECEAQKEELVCLLVRNKDYQEDELIIRTYMDLYPEKKSLIQHYADLLWEYRNGKSIVAYAKRALPERYETIAKNWEKRFEAIRAELTDPSQPKLMKQAHASFLNRLDKEDRRR